ncbi:hypothetical protein Tco_0911109 [Tanacetum coccineum]|uniref:Uncharacterized protein n=1 Tax=Tanacetum coccineum TaxID=301880 RepID=A0ABQ5D1Y2_9ASTR
MTLSPLSFRKRYGSSYETPSLSASPASSPTLPLRKRYRGTSETILDTETEGDKSEAEGTSSDSGESEEEGLGSKSKEDASEDQQQQTVSVEDTAADKPLGLGYGAARRRALELAEGTSHSTYEDLVDGTVYTDIECVMPPFCALVQTLASPEWSSGSLPVSPASLTVPSPVATPASVEPVDEGYLAEIGAQLELYGGQQRYEDHRLIHDLLVRNAVTQHELQELRDHVTALQQERSRREE